MRWGDYLRKVQVEECVCVYLSFVWFVYVASISPGPTQYIYFIRLWHDIAYLCWKCQWTSTNRTKSVFLYCCAWFELQSSNSVDDASDVEVAGMTEEEKTLARNIHKRRFACDVINKYIYYVIIIFKWSYIFTPIHSIFIGVNVQLHSSAKSCVRKIKKATIWPRFTSKNGH